MEVAKAEVEDKVKEILKLIKSKDNGITRDSKIELQLTGLINDIHNHYQLLLARNNRLRGESGKRSRGRKEKGCYTSPCSSSESEYYSSEDIEINKDDLGNASPRVANSSKQGLKYENQTVIDLKRKLISTTKGKEDLNSEYLQALSKMQTVEATNKSLRDETDERQREISALVKDHEIQGSRASAQIKELEGQLCSLRLEHESLSDQKRDLEAQFETKATEAENLGEKFSELQAQVLELELISKEKGDEIANLLKLKDNESKLISKIEELMGQVSYLQQEVDSLRASKDTVTDQVRNLRAQSNLMQQDLVFLTSQKIELESLLKGKTKEVMESLTKAKNLKKELTEKAAVEQRMLKENGGLLAQVKDLKWEMESLGNQKKNLEEQIGSKTNDMKQLREENGRLRDRMSEMENELFVTKRKYKDLENQASIDNMQLKKSQIEKQESLQQDLVLLTGQKNELESLLKGKNKEVLDSLTRMKNLEMELTEKAAVERRMLKENGDLLVQLKDLKSEMESLGNQIKELEERIDGKTNDTKQLSEENGRLHDRMLEMEIELSVIKSKYKDIENQASTDNMQLKESQMEKQESSQRVTELEQEIVKLSNKITDQHKIMKEQEDRINELAEEDRINELTEELKKAKHQILGSKASLQIAERKTTELAEGFRKKLEDNIRVLFRRIQVVEQLHNENKDSYKKTMEELKKANRLLEEKGLGAPRALSRETRDVLEPVNKALAELELLVAKLEAKGDLSNRLSKMSNDIAFAKNWVEESKRYKKKFQQQVETLVEQLDDKKELECSLKEKVSNLEATLGKQGGDKLNMIQTVSELEKKVEDLEKKIREQDELGKKVEILEKKIKEQDEGLLSLGEEKREAIRQLCVMIDHQRYHCDQLKGVIAKSRSRR